MSNEIWKMIGFLPTNEAHRAGRGDEPGIIDEVPGFFLHDY